MATPTWTPTFIPVIALMGIAGSRSAIARAGNWSSSALVSCTLTPSGVSVRQIEHQGQRVQARALMFDDDGDRRVPRTWRSVFVDMPVQDVAALNRRHPFRRAGLHEDRDAVLSVVLGKLMVGQLAQIAEPARVRGCRRSPFTSSQIAWSSRIPVSPIRWMSAIARAWAWKRP